MKTIILLGDFITIEQLTRWLRAAYTVVSEIDRSDGKNEIKRTLKIRWGKVV